MLNELLLHNEEDIIDLINIVDIKIIDEILKGDTQCISFCKNSIEVQDGDEYLIMEYRINKNLTTKESIVLNRKDKVLLFQNNQLIIKILM